MNRRGFLMAASAAAAGFALAQAPGAAFAAPVRKALPRLKTEQVGSGDLSFGYHAAGPEEGRPVVLLHDFGYDIHSFTDGYWDDNCYFNCPTAYIPNMDGEWAGRLSRVEWVIATGEHDSLVQQNRDFSALLWHKGVPNHLEIWGGVFGHDWPWWREHLRRFV